MSLLELVLLVVALLAMGAPLVTPPQAGVPRGLGLVCVGLSGLIVCYVVLHLARL